MYFCNKCGKQIESGIICSECAIKEYEKAQLNKTLSEPVVTTEPEIRLEPEIKSEPVSTPEVQAPTYEFKILPADQMNDAPEQGSVMYGFAKALVSAILGLVVLNVEDYTYVFAGAGIGDILSLGIIIPAVVLSIIFGVKSINAFRSKRRCQKRPIPALILGICGISFSVLGLLMSLSGAIYYI